MTPYEAEQLDQQRCNRQADIAEALYIDGFSDGLDSVPLQSQDEPYRLGYTRGSIERQQQPDQTHWQPFDHDEF